ncbi:hypothetical protein G0Q06_04015 [Puniceicoccales bacterium CK1056]|uniref:Uncharacterized protein n=1 Tax=Oceanipulchritudo coccoides TaxID=2706888 RepID=A0A6B2LYA2_9BACT|nr:hypothetical protein [Oceanipulchritudo coccoides]NDV61608.1 hypothetical protein [Oceanipulchritudo coccoides]
MQYPITHSSFLRIISIACLAALASPVLALDGGNDVFITVPTGTSTGWKTFEILTGDDTLGSLAQEGFIWTLSHDDWDGVGAYLLDSSTLRVFINHEAGAGSTFSRVDIDLTNLQNWIVAGIPNNTNNDQVAAPGQIVKAVSLGWTSVGAGTGALNNPCSANVWPADTFGFARGFADTLYLLGEESTGGHFWVMDVTTRTLYEAPDLGTSRWENATIVDTGRTDTVALILGADVGSSSTGTAPLQLYVGLKNPSGSFLERNGLVGGKVYNWDPEGSSTNGTLSGIFSGGNGTSVNGTWVLDGTNAALFSKLEDVHTNLSPGSSGYGVEVAVASQAEAVFTVDLSGVDFVAGDLGVNRDSPVLVLFASNSQDVSVGNGFAGMDNLVWSANGKIYVNEDDGEGDIWQIDVDSLKASYTLGDFTPDASQVFDILDADFANESSGIIDISRDLGYQAGSIFLTVGQSGVLTNNQLAMAVSPTAALIPDPITYATWIAGFPSLTGSNALATGDPEKDGIVNLLEYAFNLNPTVPDAAALEINGASGLPRMELTTDGSESHLILEFVRRTNSSDLIEASEFSPAMDSWGAGSLITTTPISSEFERVLVQDPTGLSAGTSRFGRIRVELETGP